MPRMKNRIMVRRPADEIFRYITDLTQRPDRHADVVSARQTSPGCQLGA